VTEVSRRRQRIEGVGSRPEEQHEGLGKKRWIKPPGGRKNVVEQKHKEKAPLYRI
jgi:hypothetical protein